MNLHGKVVDLIHLQAELAAAGIAVPSLGRDGDDLHTYTPAGLSIDLPPGAAPIVAAHVPPPPPPAPDYGSDASAPDQIADGVAQLRAYLALPSPTQAQTVAAVRLTIRAVLFILRRSVI